MSRPHPSSVMASKSITMESIKHALKSLLTPFTLRVRRGPLAGKKWIAASGIKFIKGTYEPRQTEVFLACVQEGDVVLDIGAHVGYYTVIAALRAGPRGRVFAFEPR